MYAANCRWKWYFEELAYPRQVIDGKLVLQVLVNVVEHAIHAARMRIGVLVAF